MFQEKKTEKHWNIHDNWTITNDLAQKDSPLLSIEQISVASYVSPLLYIQRFLSSSQKFFLFFDEVKRKADMWSRAFLTVLSRNVVIEMLWSLWGSFNWPYLDNYGYHAVGI